MNDYRTACRTYRNVPRMFMAYDRKSLLTMMMARSLQMYLSECETKTKTNQNDFHILSSIVYMHTHTHPSRHCVMLKSLCASEYYLITTIIIREIWSYSSHICAVCTLFVLFFSLPHLFTIKLHRHMSHARLHAHTHPCIHEKHTYVP